MGFSWMIFKILILFSYSFNKSVALREISD